MWPITVNALEKYLWQQHNTVFFLVQQTVLTGFICFLAAFVPWFLSLYSNEQLLPSGGFAWWSFYFRQCKRVYLNEMTKASKPHNSLVLFCNMNRFARSWIKRCFINWHHQHYPTKNLLKTTKSGNKSRLPFGSLLAGFSLHTVHLLSRTKINWNSSPGEINVG